MAEQKPPHNTSLGEGWGKLRNISNKPPVNPPPLDQQQIVPMDVDSFSPPFPVQVSLPDEEVSLPLDNKFKHSRISFLEQTRGYIADLYAVQLHQDPRAADSNKFRETYNKGVEVMTDEELAKATRRRVQTVTKILLNYSSGTKDEQTTDRELIIARDRIYLLIGHVLSDLDCPQDVTENEAVAVMTRRIIPDIVENTPCFSDAIRLIDSKLLRDNRLQQLMLSNDKVNRQVNEALSSIPLRHPTALNYETSSNLLSIYVTMFNHNIPMQNTNVEGLEKLLLGGIDLLRMLPTNDSKANGITISLRETFTAITTSFLRHGDIGSIARLVDTINSSTGAVHIQEQKVMSAEDKTRGENHQYALVSKYYEHLLYGFSNHLNNLTVDQRNQISEQVITKLNPRFIIPSSAKYLWEMSDEVVSLETKLKYVNECMPKLIGTSSPQDIGFYFSLKDSKKIPQEVKNALYLKVQEISQLPQFSSPSDYNELSRIRDILTALK